MNIKDMVNGGKAATFTHFRRGILWYKTEDNFAFGVPVEDVGDATFQAEEKAILLMRYIRKQLEDNEAGRQE